MIDFWILRTLEYVRGWIRLRRMPRNLGEKGEYWSAQYLRRRGYLILEHGCRDRMAEADLVAYHRGKLVFVEVKTRSYGRGYGRGRENSRGRERRPEQAVDFRKQVRLIRFASRYVLRHGLRNLAVRYDVIALVWPPQKKHPHLKHYTGAFRLENGHQLGP
ncbi:MAG: YraN family protein [Planctomycetota bacterium]|nr:YraN family protein [Planctomycetota bacterium]